MANEVKSKPDYGVDAPMVPVTLLGVGLLCLLGAWLLPPLVHFGPVIFDCRSLVWPGGFLTAEGLLYLLYVKVGKFRHRDQMIDRIAWRGDEQVLDVGCGRGLLLAGAAKRVPAGHATGIDVWSNVDMAGNSAQATERNLAIEGVSERCTLVSQPAQSMAFADGSFDVVLSNLCLHNIRRKSERLEAVRQIARVLKPGGTAMISDYRRTGEYLAEFKRCGLVAERRWGSPIATFPPLHIVTARKPS